MLFVLFVLVTFFKRFTLNTVGISSLEFFFFLEIHKINLGRTCFDRVGRKSVTNNIFFRPWYSIFQHCLNACIVSTFHHWDIGPQKNICLFPICCHFTQWVGRKFILFYFCHFNQSVGKNFYFILFGAKVTSMPVLCVHHIAIFVFWMLSVLFLPVTFFKRVTLITVGISSLMDSLEFFFFN